MSCKGSVRQMYWTKHFLFYSEYIFYKIIWSLNLLENQSHTYNQVVYQIWSWYYKNWAVKQIVYCMLNVLN